MKRLAIAIAASALLAACADTTRLITNHKPTQSLDQGSRIYVAIADDGMFGGNTYRGSGRTASKIIYSELSQRTREVRIGQEHMPYQEARKAAQDGSQQYLVFPTILHWEDRATEWNGIPDRVELKIELLNLQTGETISSATVRGKSGLATLGGDHPQDLLPGPVAEWAASVFTATRESGRDISQSEPAESEPVNAMTAAATTAKVFGRHQHNAEKAAAAESCINTTLASSGPGVELYTAMCGGAPVSIRCEFSNCSVQ